MIEQKEHFHGSDLEKIEKIYGIKKENIVSFAANVNPLGESGKLKTALSERIDAITKYPDREYTSLRKAIGSYCKCDYNHITVGNGCTELISLFIQITAPKKTLLLGPTYSEYERDLRINGSDISYYFLREKDDFKINSDEFISAITTDTDLVIICNPNNPTGALYPKEVLEGIVEIARQHHLIIFSDEIYDRLVMDGGEHISIASLAPDLFCVTFSGLSKSHMIAGFRIGWMILSGNKAIAQDYIEGIRMLSNMRLCSNVPAQSIVQTALGGYQSVSNYLTPGGRIYEQRECIYQALKDIPGLSVVKPKAAFYMFPKLDVKKFHITNDEQFALDLLRDKKILLIHAD